MIFCLLSLDYETTWISDFFTMRQHLDALSSGVARPYHNQYNLELQRHCRYDSAVLSPVRLDLYITPRSSHLDSAVARMTRQHCRQHDSASTSCHGQVASTVPSLALLNGIIASMTWPLHRVVAKSMQQLHRHHDITA
jgi:hypothetical protein